VHQPFSQTTFILCLPDLPPQHPRSLIPYSLTSTTSLYQGKKLFSLRGDKYGEGEQLPSQGKRNFFFLFLLFFFFFFSYFFLCQPPSHSLLLPADRQPLRSRVGFYHLVAGLLNPTALLMRAKFFNLPVPIGQDFLILLPYMTDCSIITDCQHGLNSWAPANCAGVLTTAPARYFMK